MSSNETQRQIKLIITTLLMLGYIYFTLASSDQLSSAWRLVDKLGSDVTALPRREAGTIQI